MRTIHGKSLFGRLAALLVAFGLSIGAAWAQDATAILEYFDDEREIQIFDSEDFVYDFVTFGMELLPGDRIVTRNSGAEIRLVPNGSIVRVAPLTEFVVEALAGRDGSSTNSFGLLGGRVRTVVARAAGTTTQIRTPTAVGGVRGTDFGMEFIENEVGALFVKDGRVEFSRSDTGESLSVGPGQFADSSAADFQLIDITAAELDRLLSGLEFVQLDPSSVPRPPTAPEPETDETQEAEQTPPPSGAADAAAAAPTPRGDTGAAGSPAAGVFGAPLIDPIALFLTTVLNMEIGSTTIDGQTYAKFIVQPRLDLDGFRARFYLPIIYSDNLFDPTTWYRPGGNDEWSFGTDAAFTGQDDEVLLRIGDILRDLFLKIKFIEIGEQRDPFFLKVGSLESMSLGHGILMRGYRNDADFPAIRRLATNIGIDLVTTEIELLTNDLADPGLFGLRFMVKPGAPDFQAGIALSAMADINPIADLPGTAAAGATAAMLEAHAAQPAFVNLALDLDVPIIESDAFSFVLFGDVGGLLPIISGTLTNAAGDAIAEGPQFSALLTTDAAGMPMLRNVGFLGGVLGNIAFVDYRLEYRNFSGIFQAPFYGETYDRFRGQRALETIAYLKDPTNAQYQLNSMGIYGEAGIDIIDILDIELGYFWPWNVSNDAVPVVTVNDNDYLLFSINLAENLLPLGIRAGFSYERTQFVKAIRDGGTQLFDANTLVSGELSIPIGGFLNLVGSITTNVLRDADGNVRYDANGRPLYGPVFTLETRVGF